MALAAPLRIPQNGLHWLPLKIPRPRFPGGALAMEVATESLGKKILALPVSVVFAFLILFVGQTAWALLLAANLKNSPKARPGPSSPWPSKEGIITCCEGPDDLSWTSCLLIFCGRQCELRHRRQISTQVLLAATPVRIARPLFAISKPTRKVVFRSLNSDLPTLIASSLVPHTLLAQ